MNYINDYNLKTDEELVTLIQSGNETATNILMDRYQYMVRLCSNKFFLYDGDENDIIQEGLIGLFSAIKDYKLETRCFF